ncbi:MAG: helicase-related protein, partial [Pseudomonadota bacterium]
MSEIKADVLPFFEMKPIVPMTLADVQLKMYELCDYAKQKSLTSSLFKLANEYEGWINKQEVACSGLEKEFKVVAERHLQDCRKCLDRIRDGIALIQSESLVRRAFCLMNRAMLTQQLRYRLKLREWEVDTNRILQIRQNQQPDISKPETWPDWSPEKGTKLGSWYPFQIAFILMNLRAMAEPQDESRKTVDLIWFPTGGGKTEAYLGLSAFSIFLKRIRNKNDSGTTVLMRYTLRLLTAQQYQRAASLICACESIRRENEIELGKDRITIGLWAGSDLKPNRRAEAIRALNDLSQGKTNDNPFIILKCPWCGAQMGPVHLDRLRIIGYKKSSQPSTVVFQCHNHPECAFSSDEFRLPLIVIDEDIYDSPPAIVIGTVDKFAMLPWRQEARTLFGFREGNRISPPELIIQDELHLISGPLGSMAGHYETLIYELCKNQTGKLTIAPKIIASTATITRAAQQIHALYGCGQENVFLFPPQCLDAGNSFFAYEDNNSSGRMYVGVHASGLPSHTTAQVRVLSALIQSIKSVTADDENKRDPYWTLVTYFNSLRELGHAATLIQADIREYLNAMWIRKGIHKEDGRDPRRFINKAIELTSRVPSTEIPQKLQELEISYPQSDDSLPVDICLATNMFSVGVDVQRLGLMAVIGQPKTTSEYIQATSRVGRSKEGPGLIVVVFNAAKPRDRS